MIGGPQAVGPARRVSMTDRPGHLPLSQHDVSPPNRHLPIPSAKTAICQLSWALLLTCSTST